MLTDNNYINGLFKFREKGSTKYKIFTSEKVENFIVVSFERGFYLNLKKKKNFYHHRWPTLLSDLAVSEIALPYSGKLAC